MTAPGTQGPAEGAGTTLGTPGPSAPEKHERLRGPRPQERDLRLGPYVDFGAAFEPVALEHG